MSICTGEEERVFAYSVANELGLTVPVFFAIFFPKFKYLFDNYYKCLPFTHQFITWSNGLKIFTGCNKEKGTYNTDFRKFTIPWSSYKKILHRWRNFESKYKHDILKVNDRILETYPSVSIDLAPEQRHRLLPYIGKTLNLFAEIQRFVVFMDKIGNKRYRMTMENIRDHISVKDKYIYAQHFNISFIDPYPILKFKLRPNDTIYFTTEIERYKDGSNRIGLGKVNILQKYNFD